MTRPNLPGLVLIVVIVVGLFMAFGGWKHPAFSSGQVGIAEGEAIARANCARCHAIEKTGDSPHAKAPPFRTLARRYPLETLEEALAEGIMVGHSDMPEFTLEPDEITAFLAYLDSLSQ